MEFILKKLRFIFKLNNLNEKLVKCESVVNKVNQNYNVNEINNNFIKTLKISVECNAFDLNEDKQRQCYKQLKCFWPKCRFSARHESHLNQHISHHLNKRQFVCDECNKQFHHNSNLLHHKRYVHSNDRPFVCNRINCNKSFKQRSGLSKHKIRFHSGIKRHKCFRNNCDKSFVTSTELKQHIGYKHSTERPFKCNFHNCNWSFKSPSNLYYHKKTVHMKIKFPKRLRTV